MRRILVYCPDNDPTSFYRGARPWQLLEKELNKPTQESISNTPGSTLITKIPAQQANEYKIDYISKTSQQPFSADWDTVGFYDLVFMQRPFHPALHQAAQNFKRFGAKIWIDEDDLQTDVPWDMNSAYMYMTPEVQNSIRGCLGLADIVTVSTDYLGQKLKEFTKSPVITIPNAFDLETFPRPEPRPKEKIIMWRGAAPSHLANLMSVRKPLYEVMKANPDWKLCFLGIQPWWYHKELNEEFPEGILPNIGYARHTNTIFEYYETIKSINPAIWICPLVQNDFNRSRSNNGWADAMWIGAKCVAPEGFDEWKRPGILNYTDIRQTLEQAMNGQQPTDEGWEFVKQNLDLRKINKKRFEIVKKLIG